VGFVEREAELDELVASVECAARGEASFPPRIATTLLRRISSLAMRRASPEPNSLTARERQIVQLIAEGLSNKEIGTRLFIEVATVKNHVHNILEKLQVKRRDDAVARLRLVEDQALAPIALAPRAAGSTARPTSA
jgi:DNA-binding NarL/FixJ family response regulator